MATTEEVADLRRSLETSLGQLRSQVEGFMISEREERAVWARDLRLEVDENFRRLPSQGELYQHVQTVEAKLEEDLEEKTKEFQKKFTELKGVVNAMSVGAPFASPQQGLESSAQPGGANIMHLTHRKGFEGLKEYGGGAQWQDWRFTTVDWLR